MCNVFLGRVHEWQRVKGTSFLVDCFGKSTQLLKCKSWFLTHFHSDHYKGLRASFKQGIHVSQNSCNMFPLPERIPQAEAPRVTERASI